ncbi:MAG: 16S rRNA (guanine(527)-N(7))-methyltransferase RsmG [Methylococcaceae bacterium]|nr:16S rRNA (guanine(527)-N(7))-methyltransferase RsmG [Methylococcaceae bacterium]
MSIERDILSAGITELGLAVTDQQLEKLMTFLGLIQKWNKAYNLTGLRDGVAMVRLHLLDSLAVLSYIQAGRILDIGTGAGLPGIPLAIFMPESEFVLLDSNAKKTRFVQQAIVELKLSNVAVLHARVEGYRPAQNFNTVITRAFASLLDIQQLTKRLVKDGGELLAMKGLPTSEELQSIMDGYTLIPLHVPGVDAERCLIRMQTNTKGVAWEK